MNSYFLLPLLQVIISLVLATVVIKGRWHSYIHRLFFAYLLIQAAWGAVIFGMRFSPDLEHAYSWEKWLIPLGSFMAVVWYHFSLRYTGKKPRNFILPLFYAISLIFSPFAITDLIFSGMQIKPYGYAPIFGPVAPFWIIFGFAVPVLAFLVFINKYRTSVDIEQRNRIAYIIGGTIFVFIGAAFDILPILGLPLYPGAVIGNITFCFIATIAIVKHNLLDINVVIRRGIAFALLGIVIAIPLVGVYLLLTTYTTKEYGPVLDYLVLLTLLVILIMQLSHRVPLWIDRLFYGERYNYLRELGTFIRNTHSLVDTDKLGSTIVNLLVGALRTSSVYILQPKTYGGDFITTFHSTENGSFYNVTLERQSSLIKWLQRSSGMLFYDDISLIPQLQGITSKEKEVLKKINTKLIIPLIAHSARLSGIIMLGPKLSDKPYTEEDRQLIYAVSSQMAAKLENAQLFNETRREVNERKRTERLIKMSEQRYRELAESITDVFFAFDDKLRYTYWNKASEKLIGVLAKDALGKRLYEVFPNIEQTRVAENMYLKALRTKKPQHFIDRYPINNKDCFFEISAYPAMGGLSVFAKDITERKQVEEALKESEIMFRGLAEKSPNMIFINRKGRIVYVNDRCADVTGYTKEEFYSPDFNFLNMITLEDRELIEANFNTHMKGEETLPYDFTMFTKDSKQIEVINATKLIDYEGEPAILGVVTDITERKLAEEAIKRSHQQLRNLSAHLESVREKERTNIAREIHDELGQDLTAMKMDLSWLSNRIPKKEELLLKKLESMSKITDSTIQTVKRISSQLRPGVLDDLGLTAAIEWQVQEFQNRTGVKCKLNIGTDDIVLSKMKTTAIFRIFQEILTNIARHAAATDVKVTLQRKDDKLILKVIDNGIGIKEEQINDSTSFGLIGMQERAYHQGGKIDITGIDGKGTTVALSIPLDSEEQTGDKSINSR